jgi:hypothetical protein
MRSAYAQKARPSKQEFPMAKKIRNSTRSRVSSTAKRRKSSVINKQGIVVEEERILREATKHLVFKHGMFLVATGLREARIKTLRVWIITVTLRYTTGHEGYIGDLLFDGAEFSFLTPPEVREERARQIAADPERMRKWNDYRASTVSPGEG